MTKPIPKSILSIDVGTKRVGIAGCDPLGITVTSLPAFHRKTFFEDLKILKGHCSNRNVKGLVIGIPFDQDGNLTKQAKLCRSYGTRIAQELDLPVAWVNEHSSTWEAKLRLKLSDDRTGKIDSEAAALLLEQWLLEGPELQPVSISLFNL